MRTALLLACVLGLAAGAQEPSVHSVRVQQTLDSIQSRLTDLPDADVQKGIRWLRGTIAPTSTFPDGVIKGLEGLDEALKSGGDNPEVRRLVVEDLRLKIAFCRRHPSGMAAMIPLVARTWAASGGSTVEVKQWNVMYLSAPLAVLRTQGEPFPGFSSPTSKPLPPGKYVIWAEDPQDSRRQGPRKTITLGAPEAPIDGPVQADLLVPDR